MNNVHFGSPPRVCDILPNGNIILYRHCIVFELFFSVHGDIFPSTRWCHLLHGNPGFASTSFQCCCSDSWVADKPRPIWPKLLCFLRWSWQTTVHVTDNPSLRFWTFVTGNENASLKTGLAFHRFVLVLKLFVLTSPSEIWVTLTRTSVSIEI